jgi:hypothetical protein
MRGSHSHLENPSSTGDGLRFEQRFGLPDVRVEGTLQTVPPVGQLGDAHVERVHGLEVHPRLGQELPGAQELPLLLQQLLPVVWTDDQALAAKTTKGKGALARFKKTAGRRG